MKIKKDKTIVIMLSLAALMLVLSAAIPIRALTAENGIEEISSTNDNSSVPSFSHVLKRSADMGEAYLKQIVFLGDSTTYHMIARGVLPDGSATKQVWAPRNGTLMLSPSVTSLKIVYPQTNTEMTVAEAAAQEQPACMVLTIGLNGAHTFTEAIYKGSYRKLIDAIRSASPNTKIILQSVFPVAENESIWTSLTPAELNLRIDQINAWAKDLSNEYENVRYLDTQSTLRDEKGFLKQAYQAGDGIHLTAAGYRAILEYIRNHAFCD